EPASGASAADDGFDVVDVRRYGCLAGLGMTKAAHFLRAAQRGSLVDLADEGVVDLAEGVSLSCQIQARHGRRLWGRLGRMAQGNELDGRFVGGIDVDQRVDGGI